METLLRYGLSIASHSIPTQHKRDWFDYVASRAKPTSLSYFPRTVFIASRPKRAISSPTSLA